MVPPDAAGPEVRTGTNVPTAPLGMFCTKPAVCGVMSIIDCAPPAAPPPPPRRNSPAIKVLPLPLRKVRLERNRRRIILFAFGGSSNEDKSCGADQCSAHNHRTYRN